MRALLVLTVLVVAGCSGGGKDLPGTRLDPCPANGAGVIRWYNGTDQTLFVAESIDGGALQYCSAPDLLPGDWCGGARDDGAEVRAVFTIGTGGEQVCDLVQVAHECRLIERTCEE